MSLEVPWKAPVELVGSVVDTIISTNTVKNDGELKWYKKNVLNSIPLLDGDGDLRVDSVVAVAAPRNAIWFARVMEIEVDQRVKVQWFDEVKSRIYKLLEYKEDTISRDMIICNGVPIMPVLGGKVEEKWLWKVQIPKSIIKTMDSEEQIIKYGYYAIFFGI